MEEPVQTTSTAQLAWDYLTDMIKRFPSRINEDTRLPVYGCEYLELSNRGWDMNEFKIVQNWIQVEKHKNLTKDVRRKEI